MMMSEGRTQNFTVDFAVTVSEADHAKQLPDEGDQKSLTLLPTELYARGDDIISSAGKNYSMLVVCYDFFPIEEKPKTHLSRL